MTPVEPRADAALSARLATTPMREPAPEQVRRWQAALRELPPPERHGRWADGPGWLDEWDAVNRADGSIAPPSGHIFGGPDSATTKHDGYILGDPDGPATEHDGHLSDTAGHPRSEGLRGFSEGLTAAAKGLRPSGGGSAAIGETPSSERSPTPADPDSAPAGDPVDPSVSSTSRGLRLITSTPRATPLSCERNVPSAGARGAANISSGAAEQPAAMATRPLTTADTNMAVAKIRRPTSPHHVAAAIGWLAAAIVAVAVLDPGALIRPPSAATGTSSGGGPAATSGTAPTGPAATAAGWPTDPATGAPTGSPARSSPDHPAASEPLTLTHAQLLAGPPIGVGLDPVAIPSAGAAAGPLATSPAGSGVGSIAARDLGSLAVPGTLSACLARYGSGVQPVAARRVVLDGHPGVLLVLPTELPGRLRLLVVDPRCSSALADDTVGR